MDFFPTHAFQGRHVFVAGGSTGINFGIAQGFARAGARLSIISRSADKVNAAVAALQALGSEAQGQAADVRQPQAVQAALDAAAAKFGPSDVLVPGAAGNFLALALDMSPNAFKTVVDIDLLGSFNVARLAHGTLRKPGACVIQISASQAFTPTRYQAHVCAAKAGVDMLTKVLALEWGHEGIRVNAIVPGPIADTEGLKRLAPGPWRRRPGRHGTPRAAAAPGHRGRHRAHGADAGQRLGQLHHRRHHPGGRWRGPDGPA